MRRAQPLLGTYVVMTAYAGNRAEAQSALTAAFEEVRRVDRLMSLHRADSELSRLNASGGRGEGMEVSPELMEVLVLAQTVSRKTDGAFDVTIRPLADLWGFIWKEYRLPTTEELDEVLPRVGWEGVLLDVPHRRVRLVREGLTLDLGGIAKGYAVDRAAAVLRAQGLSSFLIRAGGDMKAGQPPPGKTHWEVQLEDPEKKGRRAVVPLREAALSTSGNYENFFEVEGRRYGHLLNPRTGLPVETVAACTVVAPTCLESDAWATACLVYGAQRSLREFGDELGLRFTIAREKSEPAGGKGSDAPEVLTSPAFPGAF